MEIEQEEKRIKAKEEKERKRREYNEKARIYNEKSAAIPVQVLKGWAGSWVVVALAIVTSVTLLLSVIAFCTSFTSGYLAIISNLIKVVLNALLCAGFWMSFSMGKSKNPEPTTSGPRMLRGVFIFYKVIIFIILALILILTIVLFATMKSCTDKVTDAAGNSAEVASLNSSITGILIGVLVAVVVAAIFIIICLTVISKFANGAVQSFHTKNVVSVNSVGAAVIFFILGVVSLIGSIVMAVATGFLSGLLSQLTSQGGFISKIIPGVKVNVAGLISQIANSLTFIFGGILAVTYSKLPAAISRKRSMLEKPVLED